MFWGGSAPWEVAQCCAGYHPGNWRSIKRKKLFAKKLENGEAGGYRRKTLARVTEALRCNVKGWCFYYTIRTRGVECTLIRRAIGVREATVGVREAVILGRGLLIAALLMLISHPLFNVVRRNDGEILITVETCDKQSFASQTIVLAIANKWYELHNNQPNAKARRRRKMLVNHVIRINEENRRSADSPLLLCTS